MKMKWIVLLCLWVYAHTSKANKSCDCGDSFTQCPEAPDPVLEGSTLDLECSFRDAEICIWTNKNTTAQKKVEISDGSCDWKIHNVQHEFTGIYTCGGFMKGRSTNLCSDPIDVKVATPLQDKNLYIISQAAANDEYDSEYLKDIFVKTSSKGVQGSKGNNIMDVIHLEKENFNNSEIVCIIKNASLNPTATFFIGQYEVHREVMTKLKLYGAKKSQADLTYAAVIQRKWEEHDNGQTLKCKVEYHEAPKLNQVAETSVYLNVTYLPYLPKNYFHIKLGITEDKVVEIKSNPPLTQEEVTITPPRNKQEVLKYKVVDNQDDTCEVEITVNATGIVQETYWNVTIEARDQKLPVLIHIAGRPDETKTNAGSKGGTKGERKGRKHEAQTDNDNNDDDENGGEKDGNSDNVVIICVILVILVIIAAITAYLLIKKKRSREGSTVEEAALYKGKTKGKKDFKDLSAIPEESQQESVNRGEQGVGEYQKMQEEGPVEKGEVVAKPSPVPRSRVGQDVGEYQAMQEERGEFEEREVVAPVTPEKSRVQQDDAPAVLEVQIESK